MLKNINGTKKYLYNNFLVFFNNSCINMNYNKLQELISKNGFSMREACTRIGRSEMWFYTAKNKDTMTVRDLTLLLSLCKMSLSEFFGGEKQEVLQEPMPFYSIDLIDSQKKIIEMQAQEIKRLKEKCKERGMES